MDFFTPVTAAEAGTHKQDLIREDLASSLWTLFPQGKTMPSRYMYLSMKGAWKDIGIWYTKRTYMKLFIYACCVHFHVHTNYPAYHFGPMKTTKMFRNFALFPKSRAL